MEILFWAAILGLIPGAIAKSKGYSFGLWWFFGAALFIVALPVAIFMKKNAAGIEAEAVRTGESKKCPYCAELIKTEAKVCRFCGRDLPVVPAGTTDLPTSATAPGSEPRAPSLTTPLNELSPQRKRANEFMMGFLAIVFALGAFLYVKSESTGSGASTSPSVPALPAEPESPNPRVCLQLVERHGDQGNFFSTITGRIKNTCGRDVQFATVTFKLLDKSGDVVGKAVDTIVSLGAGETWKFKAIGDSAATNFALDDLDGHI